MRIVRTPWQSHELQLIQPRPDLMDVRTSRWIGDPTGRNNSPHTIRNVRVIFSSWSVSPVVNTLEQGSITAIVRVQRDVVIWQAVHPTIKELRVSKRTSAYVTCTRCGMRTCKNRMPRLKMSPARVGFMGPHSCMGINSGAVCLTLLFWVYVVNPCRSGITETPKSAILACPLSDTSIFS